MPFGRGSAVCLVERSLHRPLGSAAFRIADVSNAFDRDLEDARAKRDAQVREQEGWRQRAIEEHHEKMRAQAELREAVQAFIARARELGVEATPMRFRDGLVERKVGWFSGKTEKVWHCEETRGC